MSVILAYDLGTGGLKASLFSAEGKSLAEAFRPCDTIYEGAEFREQEPDAWWQMLTECTGELLAKETGDGEIACISISGHSLGAVPVGEEGLLCDRVPIWSDARAREEAEEFFRRIDEGAWYHATGNGFPPPLYSLFKIMWLKQHQPETYERTRKFIGTKDYLNYLLTGNLATDVSYASGSGAFDLSTQGYRDDFLAAAGIDRSKLCEPMDSTAVIGHVTEEAAAATGLAAGTPVVAGGVDNACMALGAGCFGEGEAYTSLGTSAWIAVSSAEPILDAKVRPFVFAHCVPGMHVSATAIFSAGSAFAWARDTICPDYLEEQANGGPNAYDAMTALAATSPAGANGLIFNPSLAGGSSLDVSPDIRGAFLGLDLKHNRADMIRAVLEGICLNLRAALDVLAAHTDLTDEMLIVGGGGKSAMWRQLFASIYGKTITQIAAGQDAGAQGAAALGAVGVGLWSDFSPLRSICEVQSRVYPDKSDQAMYESILPVFRALAENQGRIAEIMGSGGEKR